MLPSVCGSEPRNFSGTVVCVSEGVAAEQMANIGVKHDVVSTADVHVEVPAMGVV